MTKSVRDPKYRDLVARLELELAWFDKSDQDIDEAVEHHAAATALIKQMNDYLERVKTKLDQTNSTKK